MEFGINNIVFIIVFLGSLGFLAKNIMRLVSYLKTAQPDNRFDNIGERIKKTLGIAIFQSKIFRDKAAGPLHAGIFWGFLILLFSVLNSIFEGFGLHQPFNFLGPVFSFITVSTDIFIVLIFAAVLFSLIRRFVVKVKRLQVKGEGGEAAFILGMILTIVISLMFENASSIAMGTDAPNAVRPLAEIFSGMISADAALYVYYVCFWIHIVCILVFMNFLPYSKHLHVYTSIPNVFFSNLGPANKLAPINFEDETLEKYGVVDVEDLSWKSMLDGYSCTHCGRCTDVCPANLTGKPLDPRSVICDIRDRTMEKAPILAKIAAAGDTEIELTEEEQAIMDKKFVGDYHKAEDLWQCTTCGACVQECPVANEHIPAIVGMRRNLVMMESDFPAELQSTFSNLETNATPWAFSAAERADWAEGLDIKTAADDTNFDVLFWVGCAGSFDDRAKKISVAFAKLLKAAGVNFAILGSEEQCNGDIARRAGNEYLADMLIKGNIETLNNYDVKKIITICPHCFNTMHNEYPDFGGKFEVIHHTKYLADLLAEGKLKLKKSAEKVNIAYHDSCYLGRYNNMYEEPRQILKQVGMNVIEPERTGDRGLCCGAGGGQMFMEETVGKRINIERTEELLSTGCTEIAANCPFCMTMITDGVKSKDKEDAVAVRDIAEILLESVEGIE